MKTNIKETLDPKVHIGARSNVSPEQIVLLKSDSNYTTIILKDGSSILSSTTMGIIEKRLEGYNFFRPNRSTIVNMRYVQKPDKNTSSKVLRVLLQPNDIKGSNLITISRRRVESFFEYINQ